jgi:hypothetical protein
MEKENIYSQLKEAKAKMENAQRGYDQAFTLEGTYRRFVETRQRYWELLDKLRPESEEKRKILEEIYFPNLNLELLP